jgi:sulfite exporter TauE/SafE
MEVLNCISDFSTSYGLYLSLFLAGLVGGFTHCAGMCAPFVIAQTGKDAGISKLRGALLLPYHLGRMTTYVLLAVVIGSFVNLAFLFSDGRSFLTAPILLLAATLFLVSAFPVLGRVFPWAVRLQVIPQIKGFNGLLSKLSSNAGVVQRYFLGVLLGFMPCGLVVSAILAASTAPNLLQSAMAMGVFAIGTMPALMLIGVGNKAFLHKYPNLSTRVSQGAMVISSFWLVALAGLMLSGT